MTKTGTGRKPYRAFTLLELLLVLVLVAVSVAATVPHLNGTIGAWQLRETARNLQATLQLGARWACVRQEPVAFVLDVPNGSFSLRLLPDGPSPDGTPVLLGRQFLGRGVNVVRAEGLIDVGPEQTLVFRPDGTSEAVSIALTGDRAGSTQTTRWQIDLDGRGGVRCLEKPVNEKRG